MLILVTNSWDGTTFELVEWCDYLALPYNKIDEVDIRELDMVLDANSLQVRFNGGPINHFNTRSDYVIYRRGKISWANQSKLTNGTIYIADGPDNYDLSEIFNFHGSETNRFTDNLISKIDGLKAAAVCQLHFPKTIISRDLKFVKQELGNRFITKHFIKTEHQLNCNEIEFSCSQGTVLVDCDQQEILPFHTSFFQEYIEKRYEIRTFFLHGSFYSMAIFSQENAKTRIDFRNYDLERPNRFVPYRLPRLVEEKLSKLMDILNLHSGSIDLIRTPTGQYYFLEVNPQGQFQWLSHNCNYFIEREMIRRLLKFKNNNPHERAQ